MRLKRPRQKTPAELKRDVQIWNDAYKPGTEVLYHPVIGEPRAIRTKITYAAYVLGGHTAVLHVEGVSGCVALEAVEVACVEA